jgi:tetratricopeptide (TPR) repeat protein
MAGDAGIQPTDSPLTPEDFHAARAALVSIWVATLLYMTNVVMRPLLIERALRLAQAIPAEARDRFWYLLLLEQAGHRLTAEEAGELIQAAIERLQRPDQEWLRGYAQRIAGGFLLWGGQAAEAEAITQESLAIFRGHQDTIQTAYSLSMLAHIAMRSGRHSDSLALRYQARELFAAAGHLAALGNSLFNIAELYIDVGDFARACQHFREARQVAASVGDWAGVNSSLSFESIYTARYGDLDAARELRRQAIVIAAERRQEPLLAWSYWEMGEIDRLAGDAEAARRHYEQARPLFASHNVYQGIGYYLRGLADLALDAGDPNEARTRFRQSLAEMSDTWSRAYVMAGLATAALALGEPDEAERELAAAEALQPTSDIRARLAVGWAALALAGGDHERAAELARQALAQPAAWSTVRAEAKRILSLIAEPTAAG